MWSSWDWLRVPAPIRSLFTKFPLETFPAAPLPFSGLGRQVGDDPRLFIYADDNDPSKPSWDAECLKWQSFYRMYWIDCEIVGTTRQAGPHGELPFLYDSRTWEFTNLRKMHQLIVETFQIPANTQVTLHLNLIDTKIHDYWVYVHYLTDEFEEYTCKKLPIPDGPEPLRYIATHSHRKARRDELERRHMGVIDASQLAAEAEAAYVALEALLGNSQLFLGATEPGLLDFAVFAYTYTALERPELFKLVQNLNGLLGHANRVKQLIYEEEQEE